jgi:hypothetical protein
MVGSTAQPTRPGSAGLRQETISPRLRMVFVEKPGRKVDHDRKGRHDEPEDLPVTPHDTENEISQQV